MTTETETTDLATGTVELPARDLGRILHNASLFASRDESRPVLQCVHLEVEVTGPNARTDGETSATITATCTDSYVLGTDTADLTATNVLIPSAVSYSWNGDILATDLAPMVKRLLARQPAPTTAILTLGGPPAPSLTISVPYLGQMCEYPLHDGGPFPSYSQLFPTEKLPSLDTGTIALNPGILARFAKVLRSDGRKIPDGAAIRFSFFCSDRPCVITAPEALTDPGQFRALLMPVRDR